MAGELVLPATKQLEVISPVPSTCIRVLGTSNGGFNKVSSPSKGYRIGSLNTFTNNLLSFQPECMKGIVDVGTRNLCSLPCALVHCNC